MKNWDAPETQALVRRVFHSVDRNGNKVLTWNDSEVLPGWGLREAKFHEWHCVFRCGQELYTMPDKSNVSESVQNWFECYGTG